MATKKKALQAAAGAASGELLAIEDVFSTYLYTGNGTGQVIENNINLSQSNSGGSVEFNGTDGNITTPNSSQLTLGTNDFSIELFIYPTVLSGYKALVADNLYGSTGGYTFYLNNNTIEIWKGGASLILTGGTLATNQWYHLAWTRSGPTNRLFLDGTQVASTTDSTNYTGNFAYLGRNSSGFYFSGHMSNVRIVNGSAVYTSNFTAPSSELTAVANTVLLTCQGDSPFADNSTNSFSLNQNGGVSAFSFGPFDAAEAGEGGLVWIKNRDQTDSHILTDTERGATEILVSNTTAAEATDADTLTAFNADGFDLGADVKVNTSTEDYVSWTFRKAPRFFDVVTYTGDGTTEQAIPHNLGVAPAFYVLKQTSSNQDWWTYTTAVDGSLDYLKLNTTAAKADSGRTPPTDTNVYAGGGTNTNGETYVAYLWANDPLGPSGDGSDGLIACGSVTTDGSGAASVDLGWEPQWVLTKVTSTTGGWAIADNMRGIISGGTDQYLLTDQSNAEASYTYLDLTPTGFNLSNLPTSADYIYIAIRRGPMRVPESGTEVFAIDTGSGTDPSFTAGFPVDFGFSKEASTTTLNFRTSARLLQGTYMDIKLGTELNGASYQFDYQDAYHSGGLSSSWYAWMFRRAPNFFDVVAYTGTGSSNAVGHNLTVSPEMVWIKHRSSAPFGNENWTVGVPTTNNPAKGLFLNTTDDFRSGNDDIESVSDSTFTVGTHPRSNSSGVDYIAYLFASLDGVSKVGSYTGNGTSQTIDCGFTTGARFVLIKRTDSTGSWYVWDTTRGIVSGDDPHLSLNSTAAEVTNDDSIDPDSSGFIVNQVAATNVNVNTASYIFLAIA